jgi:hypothetical protein
MHAFMHSLCSMPHLANREGSILVNCVDTHTYSESTDFRIVTYAEPRTWPVIPTLCYHNTDPLNCYAYFTQWGNVRLCLLGIQSVRV